MPIKTVIVASCGKGCTETRTFAKGEDEKAMMWLRSHEKTHTDKTRVYTHQNDPQLRARF